MYMLIGVVIGFVAAIPLGPINVFVISQTLKRDFYHGILAGLTTAVLDFVYCLIALVGFFHYTINLVNMLPVMKVIAALLLLAISLRLFLQSKTFTLPEGSQKVPAASARPILGVLLLYVSNPSLYAFWFAVAGSMTAHKLINPPGWPAVLFSIACGLGSFVWYIIVVRYVSRHQSKIKVTTFRKILLFLAFLLVSFALYTVGTLFF
jgi:threonine/homoserine/homoserine lactone efflux protein